MATPATSNEFIDLVQKSGVADEKRLESYLQKLRASGGMPAEANKLAGMMVRDAILTQFQAEQLLQGKWKRFSIGKYKVLEKLGSGGMGSVFLCEHKLMRRRVAVKVLPSAKAADEESLQRFYREARAVAALDHPNIVHAYDIDQDDNLHFLVMEYVDGTNLQDLVKKTGPLGIAQACHYIRQAALGLEHAHQKKLVHRDVKPGNILVDRKGQIKVLDMGLARFFNDEEDLLTKKFEDNVLGTADYLAPEQAEDSHDVDIRADIYGLGATFYFLLTGKTPLGDGTMAQKMMCLQHKDPKPVPELRPEVPQGLWAILAKMMAKKPAQRYQVPREVAEALAPYTPAVIAPPPEAQMPRLSPAITGPGSSTNAGSGSALRGGHGTPASTPPSQPRSGTTGSGTTAAGQGAAPVPAFATVKEETPWESLASETMDTARVDTPSHSTRTRSAPGTVQAQERKRLIWVVSTITCVFVAILGFILFKYVLFRPEQIRSSRPILEVTRQPGKANAYRTVQQALRQATIGDIIELQDDVHEENLVVDPANNMVTDVIVQAAPGKEILWTSAKKDEGAYLLYFFKAKNFRFRGKGITLDGTLEGGKKVKDLIFISSHCPGLTVEDAQCQGFARTAVTIMNAMGTREDYIRLQKLRIIATPKEKPLAGIYLDINPKMQPPYNDYITISESSTFEGLEANQEIKQKDQTVVGKNMKLHSR